MNKRTAMIASLAALAMVAPLSSNAATERQALDACASKLAVELSNKQGGSPVRFNVGEGSDYSDIRLRGRSTYYLDAFDASSQEVVARVDCEVSANGDVVQFRMLSIGAGSAAQRSW